MKPRTACRSAFRPTQRAGVGLKADLQRHTLIVLFALIIAACTTSIGTREGSPRRPAHTTHRLPQDTDTGTPVPLPQEIPSLPGSVPPDTPKRAEDIAGPAVRALVTQARSAQAVNNPEAVSASLERALRIEPRNPFLWQMLASAHLAQNEFDQAQSTAQKSNSLAHGNPYVEVENWKVIAAVKQSQGDAAAALQAQTRVDALNHLLGQ